MQARINGRLGPLQRLSLVTLLCVLGVTVLVCAIGADLLTRHLVQHDAELVGDLARLLLTENIPASYFTRASPADPSPHRGTFTKIVASADVVRVVLYDATRRVLWSDDPTIIGRRVAGNRELDRALRGAIEAHITRPGKEEHQGRLHAFPRVEEIYLPVRYAKDEPVVGVLEIYRHPPKFFEVLDRGLALVWILGGSGGLLLYASLLVTARLVDVPGRAGHGRSLSMTPHAVNGTDEPARWSAEPYRTLMESLRDVVCRLAPDGTVVSLNSSFETVTGWRRAEWLGRPFALLLHPEDRPRARPFLQGLACGERLPAVELRIGSPSGEFVPTELTGAPVIHEGRVTGIVAVARDLRKRAARRESEQRLRTLIDTARDVIFTLSPKGTITSLNPAFEAITRGSVRVWIGRHFTSLVHSDDLARARVLFANLLGGQRLPVYQVRVLPRRGKPRTWEVTAALRMQEGRVVEILGIARDITERKRREEALRRLNDTMEAEAKRIAYELHNEAGQLLAAAHIALGAAVRNVPAAVQESLREVSGVFHELDEELRRMAHELRPMILDRLGLRAALEYLAQGVARRTGLRITVEGTCEGRLSQTIEASLYRAVQESVTNVVKHARATAITIRLTQSAREICCAIRDDGVGFIADSALGRAGAGLGLTANMSRVEALGGTFRIVSNRGDGTEVTMTIPLEG
jgi:PAS domain S-box-containing protein